MTYSETAQKHGTDKFEHGYMPIYERLFKDLTPKRILEIGVQGGASLRMWSEIFPKAEIIGMDINPECKFETDKIKVFIGDQSNKDDLDKLGTGFDLIIDDGSHYQKDVLYSFLHLFPLMNKDGLYIIEDCFTSYWNQYRNAETESVMEFFKKFADLVNYTEQGFPNNYAERIKSESDIFQLMERITKGISFYKGLIIVERK